MILILIFAEALGLYGMFNWRTGYLVTSPFPHFILCLN
jgi:hypothetical protein